MHQDVNSNSRGSLLKEMEIESDSDVPEFSLPPQSIVKRPKKSIRKRTPSSWRKHLRKCCRYCSNVLLVLVLCACVLSIGLLFWFSLRLYRDVENLSRRLTIEINRVQAEQVTNVEKCTSLETKMKQNMQVLQNSQNNVQDFKKQLKLSYAKIASLNGSLSKLSHKLHSPTSKISLSNAMNALKKGMADTGAEMTRISDEIKQIEKQSSSQSRTIRKMLVGLYNISFELANITGKSTFHDDGEDYLKHKLYDENHSNKDISHDGLLLKKVDVFDIIHSLNSSLSVQVKHLQTETEALKGKSTLFNYNRDSTNISIEITKVQKDMTAIHQSITRLSAQVGNKSNIDRDRIDQNSREIQLLWQELELQNESIVQIQKLVEQHAEYRSGLPSRRHTAPSAEDTFEVFSEETDPQPKSESEQRRDVLRTRVNNANSDSKYSSRFSELIEDNIT